MFRAIQKTNSFKSWKRRTLRNAVLKCGGRCKSTSQLWLSANINFAYRTCKKNCVWHKPVYDFWLSPSPQGIIFLRVPLGRWWGSLTAHISLSALSPTAETLFIIHSFQRCEIILEQNTDRRQPRLKYDKSKFIDIKKFWWHSVFTIRNRLKRNHIDWRAARSKQNTTCMHAWCVMCKMCVDVFLRGLLVIFC